MTVRRKVREVQLILNTTDEGVSTLALVTDSGTELNDTVLGLLVTALGVDGKAPAAVVAAAAPTTGAHVVGEKVYNSAPAAAGTIGWVCTTAGTPGTWKTWGTIAS